MHLIHLMFLDNITCIRQKKCYYMYIPPTRIILYGEEGEFK